MTQKPSGPSGEKLKPSKPAVIALIGAGLIGGLAPAFAHLPPDEDGNPATAPKPAKRHAKAESSNEPQPYYVDGVEYKPYVPENAAKPVSNTKQDKSADNLDDNSADVSPLVPGYVPPKPTKSSQAYGPSEVKSDQADNGDESDKKALNGENSSVQSSSAPPMKRPRYKVAIIRALDKVTAESVMFEVPVGHTRSYKGLKYTVKACETNAPDEARPDVMAYLEINTIQRDRGNEPVQPSRQIFKGWTFAASPGINAMQHAVYDAWVVNCKELIG